MNTYSELRNEEYLNLKEMDVERVEPKINSKKLARMKTVEDDILTLIAE